MSKMREALGVLTGERISFGREQSVVRNVDISLKRYKEDGYIFRMDGKGGLIEFVGDGTGDFSNNIMLGGPLGPTDLERL